MALDLLNDGSTNFTANDFVAKQNIVVANLSEELGKSLNASCASIINNF